MKKNIFLLLLLVSMMLTACNRDSVTTMSDDDIAETVDGTMSELGGGAALDLGSSARTAALLNNSIFCGLTGDTTLSATGTQGLYTWTATWTWLVNCLSGTPSGISLDNIGSSTYDGTNFDFSNTFTGDFEMTGLSNTTTEYNVNGTSVRNGSGTTTVRNRVKDWNYTNTLAFTNVKVKKSDYTIASGSGTARCVGSVVDGTSFDRTASITFNADGTYTVTLDGGAVFTFNLR
jgi:hypothetical protein